MRRFRFWSVADAFCHRHERLVPRVVAREVCDHFEHVILGVPLSHQQASGTSSGSTLRWEFIRPPSHRRYH